MGGGICWSLEALITDSGMMMMIREYVLSICDELTSAKRMDGGIWDKSLSFTSTPELQILLCVRECCPGY